MTAQKEDDNRLLLERLAILLEERNTFDSNFLKGIAEGEVFEDKERTRLAYPVPEELNYKKYKLGIRINPDSYLGRAKNKYFNEEFDNDFDEITDEVNQLAEIQDKNIYSVVVKPKINDETYLSVMGKIIRSREMGNRLFKSKFIDGFSKGKLEKNPKEEPKTPHPNNMQNNQTNSLVTRNELVIKLPIENFEHKKKYPHNDDDDYLLRIAREIKHFPGEIDTIQVESL